MSNDALEWGVIVKKIFFTAAFTIVMLLSFLNVNAAQLYYNDEYHYYDAGEIALKVNGKVISNLPMYPVIINDCTMVPVREVFEALGSEVKWHDDTCQVEIVDHGVSVLVKIGDRNTYVNGRTVPIDAGQPLPMLIGKNPQGLKSMVPVRFVAEKLGFKVSWDGNTRTVSIYEDSSNPPVIMGDNTNDAMPQTEGVFGKVTAEKDNRYDYIYISAKYGISPKITRYSDPERIALDFPGAQFITRDGSVSVSGNCVSAVRYSNHETFARVVLDVKSSTQIMILSSEKGILIRAESSPNKQIVYDAFSKRVYFDKTYAGNGNRVDNGYSVTFTNIRMDTQKIEIRDGYIYDILITNSHLGTTVAVDGSNKLTYTAEKGFFKSDSVVQNEKPVVNVSGDKVVVLDAGHGGNDPGAVGYDSSGKAAAYESHINLAIALKLQTKLEQSGIKVIQTRSTDKYVSLKERTEISNNASCDMFVSIHCNAIENAEVSGTQVYYHPSSEIGTELAENIYKEMVELTGLSPKNTQNGSHLYVIRTTSSPAVLVECAFITNESDRNYLLSDSGQETIAEAIYRGIIKTMK